MRKHRKISWAKIPRADFGKQVSVKTKKALCEPISAIEAKESPEVSTETKLASCQYLYTACEARKACCKPKTASNAIWIEKSNSGREKSLDSASCEANLALRRARPRLSREDKAKAPLCAESKANTASLPLTTVGAKTIPGRKVRTRALHSANDLCNETNLEAPLGARVASLKARALLCSAKLASKSRTKVASSLREVDYSGEAILASPTAKRDAFKAKPRAFQPIKADSNLPESLCWIGWVQSTQTCRNIWATSESALKSPLTSRHRNANKRGVNLWQSTPSNVVWGQCPCLLQTNNRCSTDYQCKLSRDPSLGRERKYLTLQRQSYLY